MGQKHRQWRWKEESLENIEDAKFIHSAELSAGGKEKEVDADDGNTRRDPIWGDSNESTDVDM